MWLWGRACILGKIKGGRRISKKKSLKSASVGGLHPRIPYNNRKFTIILLFLNKAVKDLSSTIATSSKTKYRTPPGGAMYDRIPIGPPKIFYSAIRSPAGPPPSASLYKQTS